MCRLWHNLEHGVGPGRSKLWAFSLDKILVYMLRPICGLQRAIPLETNHRTLLPWLEKYIVRDVRALSTDRMAVGCKQCGVTLTRAIHILV